MDFKNTAENLVIVLAVMITTAFVTYKVTLSSAIAVSTNTANSFMGTIEKAIDKETIKNEITNDISLKVNKIKKSDSINVNIVQRPINEQKPLNILETEPEQKACPEGSICIPIKNLTRRQKKRLNL